jgi:O-antigen ligase
MISAFFLVWTLVRRWQGREIPVGRYQTFVDVFVLLITLWLLKGYEGMYSATSIAALGAGLAIFIGLLWLRKHRMALRANTLTAIMVFGISFGIVTVMFGGSTLGGITSVLGRDETLTGRTDIWAVLLPIAMEHPIFGLGFGGFWTPETIEVYKVPHAHSGYLDVLLQMGFVGLLLVSMFLLSSCRRACRELTHDFDWGALWISYLLIAVIHNIDESTLHSFASQLTAVLLFLAVSSTTSRGWKVEEDAHHILESTP